MVSLQVQFLQTAQLQTTNLNWIGGSNGVTFQLQLDPGASNSLALVAALPAPQKLWNFASDGSCILTWGALAETNVVAYRIYGRREDESLFAPLGTATNNLFNTGHAWVSGGLGTNWFYAVVSVAGDGSESPYADTVMNSSPTLARFTADLQSGTSPFSVRFTSQSQGGITNWAWDFDSDGVLDSTEENPTIVFAEAGSYSVTLTVSGPEGADTRVAAGFITARLPALGGAGLLPDGTVELMLSAQAGRSYEIQASPDLKVWTTIAYIGTTNTATTLRDPTATGLTQRFYRVFLP